MEIKENCLQSLAGKFLRAYDILRKSDDFKEIGTCSVLFVCHDVDRGIDMSGLAFSPLIDPIRLNLEKIGFDSAVVAQPFSILGHSKAHGSPRTINRKYLAGSIRGRFGRLFFNRKYNIAHKNLWKTILEKSKATVVVAIGSSVELGVAANEHGVHLIELLHGYNYGEIPWGYDLRSPSQLPSTILSLDDKSTETFSKLSTSKNFCITVKNPWYEYLLNGDDNYNSDFESFRTMQKFLMDQKGKDKKLIVVCLQWGYGKGEIFDGVFRNGLFPEQIESLLIDQESNELWIFRLHPVQVREDRYKADREYLAEFTDKFSNAFSYEVQMLPLPMVLEIADAHLSPASGSTAEALSLGVPCLFFDTKSQAFEEVKCAYEDELERQTTNFWDGEINYFRDWIISASKYKPIVSDEYVDVTDFISSLINKRSF
jgi:hypothetical protein